MIIILNRLGLRRCCVFWRSIDVGGVVIERYPDVRNRPDQAYRAVLQSASGQADVPVGDVT